MKHFKPEASGLRILISFPYSITKLNKFIRIFTELPGLTPKKQLSVENKRAGERGRWQQGSDRCRESPQMYAGRLVCSN